MEQDILPKYIRDTVKVGEGSDKRILNSQPEKERGQKKYNTKSTSSQRDRILEMRFGPSEKAIEEEKIWKERQEWERKMDRQLELIRLQQRMQPLNQQKQQTNTPQLNGFQF